MKYIFKTRTGFLLVCVSRAYRQRQCNFKKEGWLCKEKIARNISPPCLFDPCGPASLSSTHPSFWPLLFLWPALWASCSLSPVFWFGRVSLLLFEALCLLVTMPTGSLHIYFFLSSIRSQRLCLKLFPFIFDPCIWREQSALVCEHSLLQN